MSLREKWNKVQSGAVDFFFPPRCLCCGKLLSRSDPLALCPLCLSAYALAARLPCRHCGKATADCTCCSDLLVGAGVYRVAKAAAYPPEEPDGPVQAVLFALKRENSRDAKAFVTRELARAVRRMPEKIDGFTVTFVPRGEKGRRAYGYDQMEDVSRLLAGALGLPWEKTAVRSGQAKEQKGLDRAARIENAKKTVLPAPGLDAGGKRYLIVDDVLTTGASLAAAAALLRSAGAAEVRAAVFAARG